MTTTTCLFHKDGKPLMEGIELRNSKSNPFGWSTHEVWHVEDVGAYIPAESHIADIYCGDVINLKNGYSAEFRELAE